MTGKEFSKLTRQELLKLLFTQGQEQRKLEEQLSEMTIQKSELEQNFNRLKKRLDEKDDQIAHLKKRLDNKDTKIRELESVLTGADILPKKESGENGMAVYQYEEQTEQPSVNYEPEVKSPEVKSPEIKEKSLKSEEKSPEPKTKRVKDDFVYPKKTRHVSKTETLHRKTIEKPVRKLDWDSVAATGWNKKENAGKDEFDWDFDDTVRPNQPATSAVTKKRVKRRERQAVERTK